MVYLDIVSGFLGAGKTTFVNKLLDFYMRSGEKPVYICEGLKPNSEECGNTSQKQRRSKQAERSAFCVF